MSSALVTFGECQEISPFELNEKLRPIALVESLLKLIEAAVVSQCVKGAIQHLEPRQVRAGTPDGVAITVKLLQHWADEMSQELVQADDATLLSLEAREVFLENFDAIAPLDLTNAYGNFFRAPALRQAIEHVPLLAAFTATEWCNGSSVYWQLVERAWRKGTTMRGDWRGRRSLGKPQWAATGGAGPSPGKDGPAPQRPGPGWPAAQDAGMR